jgi:hypothetical protein
VLITFKRVWQPTIAEAKDINDANNARGLEKYIPACRFALTCLQCSSALLKSPSSSTGVDCCPGPYVCAAGFSAVGTFS